MNSSYCRFCLKSDYWNSPLPIFSDNSGIPSKVKDLLMIELRENDMLPQIICHLCLAKITFLDEFNKQVKTSTNLLNSLLSGRESTSKETRPLRCSDIGSNEKSLHSRNYSNEQLRNSTTDILNKSKYSEIYSDSEPESESHRAENDVIRISKEGDDYQETVNSNTPLVVSSVKKVSDSTPQAKVIPQPFAEIRPAPTPAVNKSISIKKKKSQNNKNSNNAAKLSIVKQCTRCKFSTRIDALYKSHVSAQLECSECNLLFCTKKGLKIHKSRHRKQLESDSDAVNKLKLSTNDNGSGDFTNDSRDFSNRNDSNKDDKSKDGSDNKYQWCKNCKTVYCNEEDFIKHVQFCSNKTKENVGYEDSRSSKKNLLNPLQKTNSPDKSLGIASSTEISKDSVIKSDRKKKNLDESDREEGDAKRLKVSTGFACWKCKGIFENRPKLFTHACVQPVNNITVNKTYNSDSLNSSGDEEISRSRKKIGRKRIQSSDDDDDSDKASYINNRTSSVEETHGDNLENDQVVTVSGDENGEDNSDIENIKGNDGEEDASYLDSVVNIGIVNYDKDYLIEMNTPLTKPTTEAPKCISSVKTCNVCGDSFNSMKALVHHKRVHKSECE